MNELAGMFMLLNEGGWLAEKKKKMLGRGKLWGYWLGLSGSGLSCLVRACSYFSCCFDPKFAAGIA